MVDGKIIKFYREKAGMTQGQLGEGICSVTHLSKIERGITEYSPEITLLLAGKLNISLEDEKKRYLNLQSKLKKWHEALVMQQMNESEKLKIEIEDDSLAEFEEFHDYYRLLLARQYLSEHQLESAKAMIQLLQKEEARLSPQDRNMLKHVQGIYYFLTGQYRDCINILISINKNDYHDYEYYYHLALAYHTVHANIISYYYAEKVLEYFQRTHNIKRIIDTETIMVVQLNSKEHHDFTETKERYERLIRTCDTIQDPERKSKLYHNLAFELYRRKRYGESCNYYEYALELVDENTPHYLISLDGYISSCYKGKKLSDEELIRLANKGLVLANKVKSYLWISFQLHLFQLNGDEEAFYKFIEDVALSFLKEIGHTMLVKHYEKKLFQYFEQKGDAKKALEIAKSYMLNRKSTFDME